MQDKTWYYMVFQEFFKHPLAKWREQEKFQLVWQLLKCAIGWCKKSTRASALDSPFFGQIFCRGYISPFKGIGEADALQC